MVVSCFQKTMNRLNQISQPVIQFRVEKDGQPPMFRLSEFSVNKVTTPIGSDGNGSLTNHPCSSVAISGQNVPDHLLYDCEGNLSCVSNPVSGAVDSYWYDSVGRRIAKQENGLLTLYIWDGMDIIATANADGTLREYFTRGIGIAGDVGSLVAETRFENNTPVSTVYLHSNWRGDVVMATIPTGTVVGEYAYTTFGEPLSSSGTYTPRFGFSSKERDASGLVYYGFRYYSPVLCRWISEDPIREAGGLNLYQFCGNDPVTRVDADGRIAPNVVAGLIGAGVGGIAGGVVGGMKGGWRGAARGALAGATGGFVTGFTFGLASPLIAGAGSGALVAAGAGFLGGASSGIVGETFDGLSNDPCNKGFNWGNVGLSAGLGALGGGLLGGLAGGVADGINPVTMGLISADLEIWLNAVN